MRYELCGKVTCGDGYRVGSEDQNGYVSIDGNDVVDWIAEEAFVGNVIVTLNGKEIANGHVVTQTGWGYGEYTPVDHDVFAVGDCDLLDQLAAMEGEWVHLVLEDEADVMKRLEENR